MVTLQLVLLAQGVCCKMLLASDLRSDTVALLDMQALAIVDFLDTAAT